jgi:uncharacterized coiled-coil DUF342 family protein
MLPKILEPKTLLREKIKMLKEKADQWHNKYLEAKSKLQMLEAEKILLTSQIIDLQNTIKRYREEENSKKVSELKEKLKHQAKAKLLSGKKLSFEELKILIEDDEWYSPA